MLRIKPSDKSKKRKAEKALHQQMLFELYNEHWAMNSHYCRSCAKWLGNENKTTFHDHLLDKSKYPQYALDINNLYLSALNVMN